MVIKQFSTALLAAVFAVSISACGKKADTPKTAEQVKAEKDATAKAVRESAIFGDGVKAMDKAKAVSDDAVKKTDEALKKAE
jgi:hypothetical protein